MVNTSVWNINPILQHACRWITAYFIGSTLTHTIFLAAHEISHNLAFTNSPNACKFLMMFTQIPIPYPYVIDFRKYHMEHHKLQGTEGVDADLPTDMEAKFFQHPILKCVFMACILVTYCLRPLITRPKKLNLWNLANAIIIFGSDYLIVVNFGWGPLIWLVAAILMSSLHPMAGHFLSEHLVCEGNFETYSYYGILNKIAWNVGYHNEHHDFPGVSWTRLPDVRKLAPEFYDNIPQTKSWALCMWNFAIIPNITLFNRVKRKAHSFKKM